MPKPRKTIYKRFFKGLIEIRLKKFWNHWEAQVQFFDREIQFTSAGFPPWKGNIYGDRFSWNVAWWKFCVSYALRDGLELVTICGHCDGQLATHRILFSYDDWDSVTRCEDCETVEGETKEITLREFEAVC